MWEIRAISLAITERKCPVIIKLRQDSFWIFSGPNLSWKFILLHVISFLFSDQFSYNTKITWVNCKNANCTRLKADVTQGKPISHIMDLIILGIISLGL